MDDIEFDPYLRKSNKDKHRSVERQQADLVEGAEEQGIRLSDRLFVDPDLSASRFAKRVRPDYGALLAYMESGDCRGIALVESSRGSRTLTQWSAFLDLCRAKKIRIWVSSHERVYDPSRRRDWRVLAEDGVNAADESELLSERVLSGKRKAARDGKPAGPLVYGYRRLYDEAGKLAAVEKHPQQAPIVQELVKRVAAGKTLYSIGADLDARGVPTPRGARRWTSATIRTLVLSPAYVGKRVHQGKVFGDGVWPELVDEKLHRKVVGILTRPERRSTTRGTALTHWLSNVALCGACRLARLGAGSPAKYFCRNCFGIRVGIDPFEGVIERLVLARLADPATAEIWAPVENTAALDEAQKELDDLNATLQAYYVQAARREISPQGLSAIEAEMLPMVKTVDARVKVLSTPSAVADLGSPQEIIQTWPELAPTTRRTVVKTLADLVVLPARVRGGQGMDPRRLDDSRWVGDSLTWGEHYQRAA